MEKPGTKKYDILVRTRLFSIEIIKFCRILNNSGVEYYLRDQLGRSGTSIGANLHEGKYISSEREFCRYYQISLKSAYETLYWLEIIDECYMFDKIIEIKSELKEIIKIVSTIILNIKKRIRANGTIKSKIVKAD